MSPSGRSFFDRPVTFVGICWTTFAVAAVAGLVYAGHEMLSTRSHNSKVQAYLPRICREVAEQRDRLAAAISTYKQAYGFYPPDHLLSTNPMVVESVTNQLYYELNGCFYDRTGQVYCPNGTSEHISRPLMRDFFGADITNSADVSSRSVSFLPSVRRETLIEIHPRPQTIALISYRPNWEGFDGDLTEIQIGSWEYNSSAPRHNPGSYDLWLPLKTATTNIVIGNW